MFCGHKIIIENYRLFSCVLAIRVDCIDFAISKQRLHNLYDKIHMFLVLKPSLQIKPIISLFFLSVKWLRFCDDKVGLYFLNRINQMN